MKKAKSIKLSKSELPPISIIGIVSKAGAHRISWLINHFLDIILTLSVDKTENEVEFPYSVYFCQKDEKYFKLLTNKNPETILFKKYKNINYLFFAVGSSDKFKRLIQGLKKEKDITAVFEFTPEDFTQKFLDQYIL